MARLRHNRDFVLLQGGQLLSSAGSASTTFVYPLLVLGLTGSPAEAGLATFARLVALTVFSLPAGVAADRFDRRALMLAADGARALAVAGLGAGLLLDRISTAEILVVAFVEGAGSAFFGPAAVGALRSVVPPAQLPSAAGVQQARAATVEVGGPPLGGALLDLSRAAPFLVDAVSYVLSIAALLAMRTPFQERRRRKAASLRARLAEGFRFLWRQPFLRTTTFLYGLLNFIGPGVVLTTVVVGHRQGLTSARIGLLLAAFGGCLLLGSLASPLARRVLSRRAILLLELWTWLGSGLFVVWPDVYVLVAATLPTAIAIPITDSVVIGHRLAITPDHLVGRVESARTAFALLLAPLGPLAAGLLLDAVSARATIAVFAALALVLAVWGTLSPALRDVPELEPGARRG